MLQSKAISDEDKVYQLLNSTLNPFNYGTNFNPDQMRGTTSREFRPFKVPVVPDPRIPRSLQTVMFEGSEVPEHYQNEIDSIIEE